MHSVGWLFGVGSLVVGLGVSACASSASYIKEGDTLVAQGRYREAVGQYQQALDHEPESPLAHLGLGITYLYSGRFAQAEQSLLLSRKFGDTLRAKVSLAILYQEQKKYDEAAKVINEGLASAPDNGRLHLRLGLIQMDAGDINRAAESFQTAVSLDPSLAEAYAKWGMALYKLGDYDQAKEILEEALPKVRGKGGASIHTALGEIYEAVGKSEFAAHTFRQARKRDPDYIPAIAGLTRTMRAGGQYAEAIALLQTQMEKHPKSGKLPYELGMTYEEYGVKEQAILYLKRAIKLEPNLARAYPPLIELLEDDPKQGKALYGALANIAKIETGDLDLQVRYGKTAYKQKDFKACQEAMQRAVDIKPSHTEANYYLGLAQVKTGDRDGAQITYEALTVLDEAKAEEMWAAMEAAATGTKPAKRAKRKKKRKKRRKK